MKLRNTTEGYWDRELDPMEMASLAKGERVLYDPAEQGDNNPLILQRSESGAVWVYRPAWAEYDIEFVGDLPTELI